MRLFFLFSDATRVPYGAGVGSLWGYRDRSLAVKIKPQFADAENFYEHLAVVATFDTRQWGVIDESGAWKIPPSPRFVFLHEFHDGLAAADLCGKCIYLNHDGKQAFPATFLRCYNFAEGIGKVATKEGEAAFIDTTGKVIATLHGYHPDVEAYLSSGLIPSEQGDLIGFVNKKGEWVIPARFESVRPFVEGLAAVKEKNHWGYIDPTGKYVIPPTFADLDNANFRDFSEGLAFNCDSKTGLCGYIDHTGKFVIPPRFIPCGTDGEDDCTFSGGLARVVTKTKIGFINDKGIYMWSAPRRTDH